MADSIGLSEARAPQGMRIYAIGDVHGCIDQLGRMHDLIGGELDRDPPDDWRIVHLGDYVDRGPDTRAVLEFLSKAVARDARIVALRGNHDQGMLDFLDHGEWNGIFANNGGDATGRSYGLEMEFLPQTARTESARLAAAMPPAHRAFLQDLRFSLTLGDYFFCHAGIRPGVALDRQDPHDLLWIRKPFHDYSGLHPRVIVHGHTPVPAPEVRPNRINLDTGACFSGRLTGLVLEGNEKRLLSVMA